MFKVSSELMRSAFIGGKIKEQIEVRQITISEVAEKIGSSQPTLSRNLNGKSGGSDKFFYKVAKAIGITDSEFEELIKVADQEEYKYKYGEEIQNSNKDVSIEEAIKMSFRHDGINNEEALKEALNTIDWIKHKYYNKDKKED